MPVFTVSAARPRQELSLAIVEGEGMVDGLIGQEIYPDFPINRRTAHIIKASLANTQGLRLIADAKSIHAPGTKFERVVAKFDDDTMTVTLRGQEIVVPNEVSLDYDEYLDQESFWASRFGNETSALTKEYLIELATFSTATFGAATNSNVAYTAAARDISGPLGMNPVQDIIASIRRVKAKGEIPDTVAMSGLVWERVSTCLNTLQFVRGFLQANADVTLDNFSKALASYGIKKVLVGDSYYNIAAESATPNLVPIWSTAYIWVGKSGKKSKPATTGGVAVPTLGGVGANIYWEGYAPGGKPSIGLDAKEFVGGNYVESYPDLSIDSMIVRVKMSSLPYTGNPRAGDLIATQYV